MLARCISYKTVARARAVLIAELLHQVHGVLVLTGVVEVPVQVRFSVPGRRSLQLAPIFLMLTAVGRDLPVSTTTPVVDFK